MIWEALGNESVQLLIFLILSGFLTQVVQSGALVLVTMKESDLCDREFRVLLLIIFSKGVIPFRIQDWIAG